MNKTRQLFKVSALTAALLISDVVYGTSVSKNLKPTNADAIQFLLEAEKEVSAATDNMADSWYLRDHMRFKDNHEKNEIFDRHVNAMLKIMREKTTDFAYKSVKYDQLQLDNDKRRRLNAIKNSLSLPKPQNAERLAQYNKLAADIREQRQKGQHCNENDQCYTLKDFSQAMNSTDDYDELLALWQGGRDISAPKLPEFQQQILLANEGAQRLGFADTGLLWRSQYEMPAEEFNNELDNVWQQVKPLYSALQCHVKNKLSEKYGAEKMPRNKFIPAHLLASLTGDDWSNLNDLVKPDVVDLKDLRGKTNAEETGYNLTTQIETQLKKQNYDALKMVKLAEDFWTSIGIGPFKQSFYQNSTIENSTTCAHKDVWAFDSADSRIQMCLQPNKSDLTYLHKIYSFLFYFEAHEKLPKHYRNFAGNEFSKMIQDTISLSLTPLYFKNINLVEKLPNESQQLAQMMQLALEKIVPLPASLVVDKWRSRVFSGQLKPQQYNQAWWDLREKYQGITSPVTLEKNDFDPSLVRNIAYGRKGTDAWRGGSQLLENVLQFQFHKSLCEVSGNKKPLHLCSIYKSKEAGVRLNEMFKIGNSQPWLKSVAAVTGREKIDGTALVEYFTPLKNYLDQQNKGMSCN
jgi:peptidyl-dipeptidase A